MTMTRRQFLSMMGATGVCAATPLMGVAKTITGAASALNIASQSEPPLPLEIAVRSPWMANQVALTRTNVLFLGLPRYSRDKPTPSLARREADGSLVAFPGNAWNEWTPGNDGRAAFVYLNSVHIFADDTVWCVDQGSLAEAIFPGVNVTLHRDAQKLVQLDAQSGDVLNVLRFDATILPPGAQMNDMRFHQNMMYITDSGLGGLIVHDMSTGITRRRLSGDKVVKASLTAVPDILAHVKGGKTFTPPNSDLIEITADGKWLCWAAPTGPLYRIETRFLNDPDLTDAALAARVEHIYDNHFSGGCSMDSLGNIYFSETVTTNITVLSPDGKTAVLASAPTLIRPDGSFISRDRRLYVPIKQPLEQVAARGGGASHAPFVVFEIRLPESFNGIRLGGAVTGE